VMSEVFEFEQCKRAYPVERLTDARRLFQVQLAQAVQQTDDFFGKLIADVGNLELDDLHLALGVGKIDIKMQAAALQGVRHFAAIIAGENDQRNMFCRERADLGHRNLKVAQNFEQKCFELRVRFINLVDQQNAAFFRQQRAQQRSRQQKPIGEKYAVLIGDAIDGFLQCP